MGSAHTAPNVLCQRRRVVGLRLVSACVCLTLLLLVTGCPPRQESIEPRDAREALARVNDNLARVDQPLQYKAIASFRFRDAGGRDRRFLWHEASLVFAPPRYLLFDVRSLAGVVAEFGSNDERYWVWIEPEVRKLWYGDWAALKPGDSSRLPLPPNDLLDVLLLRPVPEALTGGLDPLLRKVDGDHRLLFVRLGDEGQPSGMREFRLDPCEPYQPLEIIDRLPDGRVQMHAHLSDYKRVGSDGPLTARKYVVYWPLDGAEVRLNVTRARFRPDLPTEVFEFPAEWQGEVERIDADAALPAESRAQEDQFQP